jgi:NADH dehydrogenase FAD-containing subunit
MNDRVPKIVIVGGGFGGLAAAKALKRTRASVTLIDRSNHHLFQPLLYQVATSILTPGQIASPIREILAKQKNVTVLLGEVTGVDKDRRCIFANSADRQGVALSYDFLVLATGARPNFFGRADFEKFAPGLKNLADAAAIRNKILSAFEMAEAEEDPKLHRDLLTFVLIGGGPTGVEMAGAIAELVRNSLRSEFRRINPASTRIILLDGGSRVLASFSEKVSAAAMKRLAKLGVETRLGQRVEHIDEDGVVVARERIASKNVIWTAGVSPSPAGRWLGAEVDHSGRVRVENDLTVPGHPEIFVIGDIASLDQDGKPLPGVAQTAIQQGRYAGKLITRRINGLPTPGPFRYFDKGNMAVVGKGFAVLERGNFQFSGFLAWLIWAFVHLQFLALSSLRLSVFVQWAWTFTTGQRGSRLIIEHRAWQRAKPDAPPPTTQSPLPPAEHQYRDTSVAK